jgi:hypothetical protein
MNKKTFIAHMEGANDACIIHKSPVSNRTKYNICTMNFDNEYICSKTNKLTKRESNILLFCWDTDSYKQLDPTRIKNVIPLNTIMGRTW